MEPVLQLALDFVDLGRALKVAEEAALGGVDWLEAGTPLIKAEGLDCVRELKNRFPSKRIIADMKVMDAGRYEVEAAAKAGADVVVVLGVADDSTIKDAVDAARNIGCEVMVDLINVDDMPSRAKALEVLGVDYICIHVGIDQQMRGVDPLEMLGRISGLVETPLAVAGGINSESAALAVKAGAQVVIVGGAITKAADAKEAASVLKRSISDLKPVESKLYKKHLDPLEVLSRVSTANIADAMHRTGDMAGVVPLSLKSRIAGRAVTVQAFPGDWSKPVEAIDLAGEGDVIVIDAGGTGKAVWGELASMSARLKGVRAVVIDGFARDIEDIRKLGFPVFARGARPAAGEPKGFGEINIPIVCAGQQVKPGDYVVGDFDGVVVIPGDVAVEVANRAQDIFEKENRIRKEIGDGSTLSETCYIKKWEKQR